LTTISNEENENMHESDTLVFVIIKQPLLVL